MSSTISMINTRGRVVEISSDKASEFQKQGFRVIINPREKYYPDLDQTINKTVPPDELGMGTKIVEEADKNPLGIISV